MIDIVLVTNRISTKAMHKNPVPDCVMFRAASIWWAQEKTYSASTSQQPNTKSKTLNALTPKDIEAHKCTMLLPNHVCCINIVLCI